MVSISLPRCMALSDKLRGLKQLIAEAVTEDFFQRHPDWLARYGERGRKHGIEDASFHIEFLAGAVECGISTPFEDYARWTVRSARGPTDPPAFCRGEPDTNRASSRHSFSGSGTLSDKFIPPRRLCSLYYSCSTVGCKPIRIWHLPGSTPLPSGDS